MATKSIRLSDGTDTLLPESAQSASGYQKCADGTLIQWGVATNSAVAATSTVDMPVVFKYPFIANPIVLVSLLAYVPDLFAASSNGITKTGFTGRFKNGYTQSISANLYWIAIGRWK